jgi:hypothetical protein
MADVFPGCKLHARHATAMLRLLVAVAIRCAIKCFPVTLPALPGSPCLEQGGTGTSTYGEWTHM